MKSGCGVLLLIGTMVFICGPATALADETPMRYDDYKLVRVDVSSWDQIKAIHDLGAILMTDAEGIGLVDYVFPPESMADLAGLGVTYKVLDDDIQRWIDAERAHLRRSGRVGPRDPAWFEDYKTFDEIVAKLEAMVADHPDLCTLIDIGDTIEGRDIWVLRISGPGEDKPAVLFNGTQHAREWITPMVTMWIADKLVYGYDTDPYIQSLVDGVEFFIAPVVNADGYVFSWTSGQRLWRKNRRDVEGSSCFGVDPNRNWGAGWGGSGSSGDPCDETYRGAEPFSEPCTAAVRDFVLARPQIVSNIDFHNYGQLILSPYGYTSELPDDHGTFMDLGEAMHDSIMAVHGEYYEWGPLSDTLYSASGGSVDWFYDDAGAFSFTIEVRPEGAWPGFELPADEIIPTCEENFPAAMYLAEWSFSKLMISFPQGLPARLLPDTPETVIVKFTEVSAELDTASPRVYTRISDSGSFDETYLWPVGDNRYEATLPATPCGKTLQYYFAADTTDGDTILSPYEAPDEVYDVEAAPLVLLLNRNMDFNPFWTPEGNWEWGVPTGGGSGSWGGYDPTSGYTGFNVYGYNLDGDYENNMDETHLTTLPFNCADVAGTTLSFYRWLGVENPIYDHAYVRVSNDGSTWHTVWQNTGEVDDQDWVYQELDISEYADGHSTVQLRWTMGETDVAWVYCGWNIDDVKVWAADPAGCPFVAGDLNCDGNVNFFDIDAFVLAITDEAGYAAAYPDCDIMLADINEDGLVNFFDIDGFVALITQ